MQNGTWYTLSDPPLISALCVTEDRPEFIPWLLWNHAKQDHPRRELIIVDSSREPLTDSESGEVKVIRCAPGTTVARKRNLALRAARGNLVTWFDDDDWQHPRKLSILAAALSGGAALAGSRTGWFLDLRRDRVRPYTSTQHLIFNSIGVQAAAAVAVPFDEAMVRASDTAWLTGLRAHRGRRGRRPRDPLGVAVPSAQLEQPGVPVRLSPPARRSRAAARARCLGRDAGSAGAAAGPAGLHLT